MAGDFDDHSTVVVLAHVVKQMLIRECLSSSDPRRIEGEWIADLRNMEEYFMRATFDKRLTPDAKVNSISVSAQFKRFADEFKDDLQSAASM